MIRIQKPMSITLLSDETRKEAIQADSDKVVDRVIKVDKLEKPPVVVKSMPVKKEADAKTASAPISKQSKFMQIPWVAKLRKIKHIEIYAAVAVVAVMVLIYLSTFGAGAPKDTTSSLTSSEDDFVKEMEQKLVTTLSNVKGAGSVSAMVTATGSATLEIAYDIDEKTITQNGTGGTSTTTTTVVKTPVIVTTSSGPQPLVLLEIKPQLKGIVIVATGASDPSVRLNLLRAVQTLVSDSSVNIEILAGV